MIIHADMDAFYASIEIRQKPYLADKPLAVGGSPQGRGVISAANYVARTYGIHSAQPSKIAVKKCPKLILLPPNMKLYVEVSQQIHEIFARYTPEIEPLSLDEAFLDVTKSEILFGPAIDIARQIKDDILKELKLVVSVGIAPNKYLAKIASDLEKPDGFVFVDPKQIQDFLDPLPISRIWGVGKKTQQQLGNLGISTIHDIRCFSQSLLVKRFGKQGEHIWRLAHGLDTRKVISQHSAKSISNEQTFAHDISDVDILRAYLLQLVEQISWRARRNQLKGRTIFIKIRDQDFNTVSRRTTLNSETDSTQVIWQAAKKLFMREWQQSNRPVRLIGVGIAHLHEPYAEQMNLFNDSKLQNKIDGVSDEINKKFGKGSAVRGGSLKN